MDRQEIWVALYLALTVSILLLVKVFLYDQCYLFDTNDDVNHTFVNLKAAQDILRQGALPSINLYNNFGTPLLGDALTFPFAIQSITYWFLPDHLAMTANRVVISFLTIIFLFLFLRQFLSQLSALVCSLIVFFSPGQFWNMAHHHYQMALLFLCFILYVQSRNLSFNRATYLLLLWIAYSCFFLSVSIQPVLLAIPFLLLFLPFKDGFRAARASVLNFIALLSAGIATWPHTAVFFESIAGSTRAQWTPYSGILSTTREQLLALILPPGEWMHYGINGHFSIVTYFSIAFLVFAAVGILSLTRKAQADSSLLRLIILLGVVPAVGGFILQFYGDKIPFVRSVDSTRVWWFSNVFFVLALGRLLDSSWKGVFPWFFQCLIGMSALVIAYIYFMMPQLIPEFGGMNLLHRAVVLGTVISLLVIVLSSCARVVPRVQSSTCDITSSNTERDVGSAVGKGLIISVLLLAQVPTLVLVMGLNIKSCDKGNHYFAHSQEATFQPQSLLKTMKPGYRMASEEPPVGGHDLKAVFGGVLGSNARAIVASGELREILNRHNLVKLDDTYFFSPPWNTEKLSRLGIRYLLLRQQSSELETQGWEVIASEEHLGQRLFLYENSSKASLTHLLQDEKPVFLKSYELVPNGIKIQLPELDSIGTLVVSFFYRDSWHAWVDGKKAIPAMNALGMMQIPIKPGDRAVLFQYQGLKAWNFLIYLLFSVVILLITYFAPRLRRGR